MSVPLLEHLPWARQRIAGAPHLLVLLDYDGTLTPLVDHPSAAHLAPEIRRWLAALERKARTTVAIVSGRPSST